MFIRIERYCTCAFRMLGLYRFVSLCPRMVHPSVNPSVGITVSSFGSLLDSTDLVLRT